MPDTKFKPGTSGNPRGRPRRKSVAEMVGATNMADIVKAMVKAATGGDVQAAKLIVPPQKPELAKVRIDELTEAKTHSERGAAILTAAGRGEISPDVAVALSTALANTAKVAELDELVKRMEAIEAALKERIT
jgi:hypothetical protein